MGLLPPNLNKEIKNCFSTILKEIKKRIIIYSPPQKEDCPNCISDHTGASVDKYDSSFTSPIVIFGTTYTPTPFTRGKCPICRGKGHIEYSSTTGISALVRWNPPGALSDGDMSFTPAGIEGRNVASVRADRCYYELLRDCVKATIDGVDCELYLPPALRSVGTTNIMAIAYFVSVKPGFSVKGT